MYDSVFVEEVLSPSNLDLAIWEVSFGNTEKG